MTAILTPFDLQGNLALEHFPALIEFQRQAGVDGLVVCGTNGEGTALSVFTIALPVATAESSVPAITTVPFGNFAK